MQLFHYHWWTDKPEEMEKFYQGLGFETNLRSGNYNGEMQTFNPPLNWDDFREKDVRFRIIQMVKGQTNITFGQGKRDIFDHIGILVNETEYAQIMKRAQEMDWTVNEGERRTFISTPWKWKIELQQRTEYVTNEEHTYIKSMEIHLPCRDDIENISYLLDLNFVQRDRKRVEVGNDQWNLVFYFDNKTSLDSVVFLSNNRFDETDPVHTKLIGESK